MQSYDVTFVLLANPWLCWGYVVPSVQSSLSCWTYGINIGLTAIYSRSSQVYHLWNKLWIDCLVQSFFLPTYTLALMVKFTAQPGKLGLMQCCSSFFLAHMYHRGVRTSRVSITYLYAHTLLYHFHTCSISPLIISPLLHVYIPPFVSLTHFYSSVLGL